VQAYEGDFPGPRNGAELAEAAIGQGRVQASPLSMALVAAAVADGEWRPPRLVSARLLPKGGSPPHPIPRALLAALRPMMRSVVTSGTAAAAGMPAGVAGKTGTAEYDNAGHSHAWFIGYKGDFAFAVFVQGGESGPAVAAPLAARFLKAR
jgi:cell division protein FtsI/penicillin-binding protein 2